MQLALTDDFGTCPSPTPSTQAARANWQVTDDFSTPPLSDDFGTVHR